MGVPLLCIASYLIGSIPTAYIIGRMVRGIDIRKYGSGNVGGSNVYYNVGKRWAFPLGFFEIFVKGACPIWVAIMLLDIETKGSSGISFIDYIVGFDRSSPSLAIISLSSIVGHNWSIFLKFQGGRGLAVATGAFFAIAFYQLLIFISISVIGWRIFKSSGIWVLVALLVLPVWSYIMGQPITVVWYCAAVLGLVILKRLTSNWTPIPEGSSFSRVLLNRLLQDRDVADRGEWMSRTPEGVDRGSL